MGLQSLCGRVLLGFSVSLLLFAVTFCYADDKTIQVVGIGECADCKESNIKTTHAFSGLRVTIDCKVENGEIKTRGEGKLDKDGKLVVSLPQEMVKDGKLKEDCYAQLHSAYAAPCPAHNGIDRSKIVVIKSENDEKHTLKAAGNLKFSTALCTSAFLWPHYKYPPLPKLPPFPKIHSWKKKHYPKMYLPLPPIHKKPFPPIYKKPLPPPILIYKPKPKPTPPVFKPPTVPIYKPKPKPLPPPKPIYKPVKPLPPPVPIYKPIPPFYKKPRPPLFPKVHIHPKIPPKYFHHPLFPPLPPSIPHP
ncbi:PREDICTED: proline-rich protein 4-like [Nicotiana attenuata]|uniref:Proline-rich protein 4 n=1 Tax=Nicotiana attenuata TaxID=49451 RepID=A0A1J6L251_NICAT|nr:PREDICTED: proline-rich protein 4-like [Nicotiana attenuata]OIT25297.1 proline-rich protein 4 [Nicotiana attenuata]